MAEEVAALGVGVEEFLVLFGGEGEVAIEFAALEAEVKKASGSDVCGCGQKFGLQRLPVQIHAFCLIPDCAHDPEIVGTISLRWWDCHAASVAALAGKRFQGRSSEIRLIGDAAQHAVANRAAAVQLFTRALELDAVMRYCQLEKLSLFDCVEVYPRCHMEYLLFWCG